MAYSGEMQWRTRAGDEVAARLGEPLTKDLTAQALRTALDPTGAWIPSVLAAADTRLTEVRRHVPDAGGLVIATDQDSARAYAALLHDDHAARRPTVVLSDEKAASKKIAAFTDGDDRWMVAVRMVSEGVDVPRLAVGVYATTTSTPLFFAQAVGRFVRARRARRDRVGVPAVGADAARLRRRDGGRARPRARAARITDEDDIFAAEDDLLAQANAGEARLRRAARLLRGARLARRASTGCSTTAASSATRARCTSAPRRRWTSSASPGLLEPDQVRELLHHAAERARRAAASYRPTPDDAVARGHHPRAAGRPAPRAQRAGRRLAPPHRPAARRHPRRAAQGVRRPGRRRRHRRPAARADRPAPRVGRAARRPDRLTAIASAHGRRDLADAGPRPARAADAGGDARAG